MKKIIKLTKLCPKGFGVKFDEGTGYYEIIYNLKKNRYTSGETLEEAADKAIEILTA